MAQVTLDWLKLTGLSYVASVNRSEDAVLGDEAVLVGDQAGLETYLAHTKPPTP